MPEGVTTRGNKITLETAKKGKVSLYAHRNSKKRAITWTKKEKAKGGLATTCSALGTLVKKIKQGDIAEENLKRKDHKCWGAGSISAKGGRKEVETNVYRKRKR